MSVEASAPNPAGKLPIYILLCFLWINIAPFLSTLRTGPASGFYLEAASAAGLTVLLFLTARQKLFSTKIPPLSFLLLAMAAFWWLQARLMNLIYPGMNDIVSWVFILLAISAWACRCLAARFGQERIVTLFAWSLFIGALLQSCVAIMQFAGWSDIPLLQGIIAYSGGTVNGQLGQRNHLGHYLMWGRLAAAYLHSQRKIPAPYGVICLTVMTAVLGLVNSRTILGYIAAISLILPCWYFHSGKPSRRIILSMAAAIPSWNPSPTSAMKLPSNASATAAFQARCAKSNGTKPSQHSDPRRCSDMVGIVLRNKLSCSMPNNTISATISSTSYSPIRTTSFSNSLQKPESAVHF